VSPAAATTAGVDAGAAPRVHFPALDGLRCVAFLLVFAYHVFPKTVPVLGTAVWNGWCGVDLFFTLSGFLVTYLLLREEGRREAAGQGTFSLLRFWARRSLRIWPLYYLLLLLSFVVIPALPAPWSGTLPAGSAGHEALVERYGWPSATFLLNWAVIRHGWPDGPLGPLWSVSIEEQFYVAWPLLLFLLPRRARWTATWAGIAAAGAGKALLLDRGYLAVYVNSFARADAFLVGALIAQVLAARGSLRTPPAWFPAALLAVAAVLFSLPPQHARGPVVAWIGYALLDLWAAGLVWACLSPGNVVHRLLALRPSVWMGKVSYGLYCFHVLAIAAVDVLLAGLRDGNRTGLFYAARVPAALALTIGLAALSFSTYERVFLRLKDRFA